MKRNLLINTLNNNDLIAMNAVQVFKKRIENLEVINTDGTKINGCIGCTDCWIKTPGICLVNDDFNQIFMDFINSDSGGCNSDHLAFDETVTGNDKNTGKCR